MNLSTKARYATRAMIELALHYGQGPVQLKEIARRQDISDKYLDQVMHPLRTSGYVYTQKGSQGGYTLARTPDKITIYDIVQNVEGSLAPVVCVDNPNVCKRINLCVTRDVWSKLKKAVITELKSMTLADLAAQQKKLYASLMKENEESNGG